ncbi:response regulator receiver modulated metal dependent phosphohydrolase [Desulfofarcimen acetoxidans DSM 771]|uniref:Stage 0 sporulation protein A homolog n=1 Tax=Desulfofarcimen acetoxidans (strain ATCC 49208 / DSM 771 / KCTC 5769 / VKM B-1644 / 5575) TaxID=485916 RepID=C8VZB9_DESAS|nr:HD domain-containing phosphohydrolase [Desulfofarcimen acetoxidans]ACV64864.1 response regulator receiver modulated metal dependent phosphohydrolase [Desulfofarcimen acetoxidans DSM 771]
MLPEQLFHATILIADDNSTNILLLEKLLSISGYKNIKTTTESREVLSLYKELDPDLLLLDLRMPHMDGFQVLEQLNLEKQDDFLPVVVITAQNDQEHRLKSFKMGAKDFIGKPFDHAEVLMRIRNMLEIRLLHKEVREHNRKLEDTVQERTKELQDLQVELIHRLGRAAEFRDNDTGAHITRIGKYSFELAKAAGLSDKECRLILHASTMHDIGKIGIADEILLKPERLTPDEWEIMKTHTTKGAKILAGSSSDVLQMAEQIALNHHEKWDGSGYPTGLKGDEIPLAGRITAICDVFDALLSKRPYKNAWSLEEAVAEMKKGSGTHFDPNLIEIFLKIIPHILAIRQKYS